MKLMLISVLQSKEVRVAIVHSNGANTAPVLNNVHIEKFANRSTQGNIYKAKVISINEQLQAAFVDYGDLKHGLLTLDKLHYKYGRRGLAEQSGPPPRMADVLKVNDDVLVQVEKDARVDKGAALTAQIQLQGQHVVLNTNRPVTRVSRQIAGEQRTTIRNMLPKLKVPHDCGLVIRTSARRRSQTELQTDVQECVDLLNLIQQAYADSQAPRLLYESNNLVNSVLRDNLHNSIERVIIDDTNLYEETSSFVKSYMPDFSGEIQLYRNEIPLYTKYRIESQVSKVFDRSIELPSGGQIVLDPTEALLTIDVNSAQFRFNENFRDMVLSTNLEAADEIFNQLRLRDIGGLIVVDFIDLYELQDIRTLEDRVAKLCDLDRGRTKWEPISAFGLMELQRRRPRSSIYDTDFQRCDGCGGHGYRQTVESVGHRIFREIEARSHSRRVARIRARVTPAVAEYLTNDLRPHLSMVEMRSKAKLEFIPDQTGEDSSFAVESFSTAYSKSPIKTKTYEHGIAENGKHKKGKISRDTQAESIQTAAVQRPVIERKPSPPAPPKKTTKNKTTSKRDNKGPTGFWQSLLTIPSYLYRRLFLVQSKSKDSKNKRKTSSNSRKAHNNKTQQKNRAAVPTRIKKKVTKRSPNKATASSSRAKRLEERSLPSSVPTSRNRKTRADVAKSSPESVASNPVEKAKPTVAKTKKKRPKQTFETKDAASKRTSTSESTNVELQDQSDTGSNGKPNKTVDNSVEPAVRSVEDKVEKAARNPRRTQQSKTPKTLAPDSSVTTGENSAESALENTVSEKDIQSAEQTDKEFDSKKDGEPISTDTDAVEETASTDARASNDPRNQPKADRPRPIITS